MRRIAIRSAIRLVFFLILTWSSPTFLIAQSAELTDDERVLIARDTFLADESLRPLNLGVQINGPVAKVFGTVPSQDARRHAELLLMTVPGVRQVHNECDIVKRDLAIELVGKLVRGERPPTRLPNEPDVIVALPNRQPSTPFQNVSQKKPVKIVPTKSEPVSSVSLFPPPEVAAQPVSVQNVSIEDLPTRLNRVMRSDRRFNGLAIQMSDRDIRISGNVVRESWVWELADRLADTAEGRRIVVGRIDAQRP